MTESERRRYQAMTEAQRLVNDSQAVGQALGSWSGALTGAAVYGTWNLFQALRQAAASLAPKGGA